MRGVRLRLVVIGLVFFSARGLAQTGQSSKAHTLRGCWRLEAGTFRLTDSIRVDSGQTTLPRFIQFDTVPGRSFNDRPMGQLVRGVPPSAPSLYGDGYFTFPHPDTVRVEWTSGITGMTLTFPFNAVVMRGCADAWTDYEGAEWAPITIRRSVCPS